MKINASAPVLALTNKPYEQPDKTLLKVGNVIAEALATDQTSGKFKLYTLAQKFFNDDSVEVDAADLALIKKAVEGCAAYNNIIIGQVLGILEETK